MTGIKIYELHIDTDGAGPIEIAMQGSLQAAGEMEGIYALIAGYVMQAEAARQRLLEADGETIRVVA